MREENTHMFAKTLANASSYLLNKPVIFNTLAIYFNTLAIIIESMCRVELSLYVVGFCLSSSIGSWRFGMMIRSKNNSKNTDKIAVYFIWQNTPEINVLLWYRRQNITMSRSLSILLKVSYTVYARLQTTCLCPWIIAPWPMPHGHWHARGTNGCFPTFSHASLITYEWMADYSP